MGLTQVLETVQPSLVGGRAEAPQPEEAVVGQEPVVITDGDGGEDHRQRGTQDDEGPDEGFKEGPVGPPLDQQPLGLQAKPARTVHSGDEEASWWDVSTKGSSPTGQWSCQGADFPLQSLTPEERGGKGSVLKQTPCSPLHATEGCHPVRGLGRVLLPGSLTPLCSVTM